MHDFRAPVSSSKPGSSSSAKTQRSENSGHHSDDDESFPQPDGDADGGYSYHGNDAASNVPLITKRRIEEEGDVIFEGDEELVDPQPNGNGSVETTETELVPYAHRDLKPGFVALPLSFQPCVDNDLMTRNIMIADDGVTPILMDFGSTIKARIPIETRNEALAQQVQWSIVKSCMTSVETVL